MSLGEICQRAAIVSEARSWIGTPYHHQADIKGTGVDCGMLLVRVFVDAGLCEPFDPRPYADDWYLHRTEEKYLGFIFERSKETKSPQLGDVMVFKYGRCYSHGGVIVERNPLRIVHAYHPARCVLEETVGHNMALNSPLRMPKIFSYWAGQ